MVRVQKAFLLINVEPGQLWKIADSIKEITGVITASAVTGAFDVIVYVEGVDMSALGAMISVIHSMDGVERTQTAIEIPPRVQ